MSAIGWFFAAVACLVIWAGDNDAARFFVILAYIHWVGGHIIRAIQKGAE